MLSINAKITIVKELYMEVKYKVVILLRIVMDKVAVLINHLNQSINLSIINSINQLNNELIN